MKKLLLFLLISTLLTGCNTVTKQLGGDLTIKLEPNRKLEEITWKNNSLWYLTREMRDDEYPELHKFEQKSEFGLLEGTVTIVESKEE